MNAVLQVLYYCPEFRAQLAQLPARVQALPPSEVERKRISDAATALADLYKLMDEDRHPIDSHRRLVSEFYCFGFGLVSFGAGLVVALVCLILKYNEEFLF